MLAQPRCVPYTLYHARTLWLIEGFTAQPATLKNRENALRYILKVRYTRI